MNKLAKEIESLDEEQKQLVFERIEALFAKVTTQLNRQSSKEKVTTVDPQGESHTNTRSTVNTSRLSRIMRELDKVEREVAKALYDETVDAMEVAAALTVSFLMAETGVRTAHNINVDKSLGKTVVVGDKTLQQRTQVLSSELTADVRKAIRQGVLGGVDVSDIVNNVSEIVEGSAWQVNRMVESEIYTAYRYQFGHTSDKNGFDWIRIHESFPRHPRRKMHRCYPLANADKYGKGKGVYKSTDVEIFFPHPQCTSWLELVEVEGDAD